MTFRTADPATITDFHAHIYYDPATKPAAARLRERVAERFPEARIGSWHDELVGPHLKPMYQLLFLPDLFATLVPWLMLNREGLDILVHPSAGDAFTDHTDYAMWLGTRLPVNEPALKRDREAAQRLRKDVEKRGLGVVSEDKKN
jgi:aromatic ring-cleaving dioxygenase